MVNETDTQKRKEKGKTVIFLVLDGGKEKKDILPPLHIPKDKPANVVRHG